MGHAVMLKIQSLVETKTGAYSKDKKHYDLGPSYLCGDSCCICLEIGMVRVNYEDGVQRDCRAWRTYISNSMTNMSIISSTPEPFK